MEPLKRHAALHTILDILEELQGGAMGISELARQVGHAKSGVHNIVKNLEARGYVRATADHQYSLGLRLWELGTTAVADLDLRETALPHLKALAAKTGEASLLSVYDRGDAIYLEKISSAHPVVTTTRVGGRSPAFCSATGKAQLAWLPSDEVDRVLSGPLPRFNDNTVDDPELIRRDLEEVRRRGYAVNLGTWRGEIHGVASPIRDHTGAVVAAVGLAGPAFRFGDEGIEAAAPDVVSTAKAISSDLGWVAR